jgi:pimeloyl-ACP methyl ester carboxylesterase
MPTITRDGIKLAYDERGSGDPAFVFIHGWCCNRSFFAAQADHFARRHRVVCLDLRGHGESDKPEGPYPMAQFADDVAHVIGALGLGKVVAVGHSMGGTIALQLGAVHPDKVNGIVMLDPAPIVSPPEFERIASDIVRAIEGGDLGPARQFIVNGLFQPAADKELVDQVVRTMLAATPHVSAAEMKGILAFDGRKAAARCKVPALHLMSTPPFNPPHIMSEFLPKVVHGWAVGATHFTMMETPDQVNSMIEGFLRYHLGRGGAHTA